MSKRDTQFQNFAKLVVIEIAETEELMTDIIARRAYDLVMHAQLFMPGIENVPDIQTWDDVPEEHE